MPHAHLNVVRMEPVKSDLSNEQGKTGPVQTGVDRIGLLAFLRAAPRPLSFLGFGLVRTFILPEECPGYLVVLTPVDIH